MKHRLLPLGAILIFSILPFGCNPQEGIPIIQETQRLIVPRPGEGMEFIEQEEVEELTTEAFDELQWEPPETIVSFYAINENLDQDTRSEQLVLFRDTSDPMGRLSIGVVDFDNARGTYILPWSRNVQTSNPRATLVYVMDVLGDHKMEIVVQGISEEGEQTLDLFQQTGSGLNYQTIVEFSADVSISIETFTRSEAYFSIQLPDDSFDIVVQEQDLNDEGGNGLIEKRFVWSDQNQGFVNQETRQIPGVEFDAAQLSQLQGQEVGQYEVLLDGFWQGSLDGQRLLLFFDQRQRTMGFFRGDRIESYLWESTLKTASYSRVLARIQNEHLRNVRYIANLSFRNLNNLVVRIAGHNLFEDDRFFRKVVGSEAHSVFHNDYSLILADGGFLNGAYLDDAGGEYTFSYPRLIFRDGDSGEVINGNFAVYDFLDHQILDIQLNDQRRFSIRFLGDGTEGKIIEMRPVSLHVYGFTSVDDANAFWLREIQGSD